MGWIASGFTIVGVAVLPRRLGYLMLFIGNMCWMLEGINRDANDIIFLNCILALLTVSKLED